MTQNLLDCKIGKSFLRFVSLNILSALALSFYILADTMFVANGVGADGLTALNIVLPFYSILNGTGVILGIGGATRYSIARGAGNQEQAKRIFTQVFTIGAILGGLYTILGLSIPRQICSLLGADGQVIDLAVTYLRSLSICNLPFVVNHIVIAFVRNDNSPNLAMAAVVGSSLFNILFDWILIYPCDLGIFGASFATGFSSVVSIAIASIHFMRKKNSFGLCKTKFYWKDIRFALGAGFPSMLSELANGIVILVFNQLLYQIQGNLAINVYSVVANLSLVAMSVFNGISQGVQPLFSYNYGANNQRNINKILIYGCVTAVGVATVFGLGFHYADDLLIGMFNKDNVEQMYVLGREAIQLYDIAFWGSALNIMITALFASCGRPIFSFVVSTLRGLVLPVAVAFGMANAFGLVGVWLTVPVAEYCTLAVGGVLLVVTLYHMLQEKSKASEQEIEYNINKDTTI